MFSLLSQTFRYTWNQKVFCCSCACTHAILQMVDNIGVLLFSLLQTCNALLRTLQNASHDLDCIDSCTLYREIRQKAVYQPAMLCFFLPFIFERGLEPINIFSNIETSSSVKIDIACHCREMQIILKIIA